MPNPAEIAHGPMFIGIVFNILLYGIMISQTYLYYVTYKEDKLWLKALVAFLFVADTLNSVFDVWYIYESLVIHYGDPMFLSRADWVFATDPAMTCIIATAVQLFFAWRVKVITGNIPVTVAIVIFSVANFFAGLATSIAVGIIPQFIEFQKFQSVVILWLASASVADVLITATLVTNLRGRKTGFQLTDSVVNRIIRLTVQTGMATAVTALIDLILFPSGLHLIFNMPLSKLYTNSLMSSLNARGGWKFQPSQDPSGGAKSTENHTQNRRDIVQLQGSRVAPPEVRVNVHSETHELVDRSPDQLKGSDVLYMPPSYSQDLKERDTDIDSVSRRDDIV